MADINLKRLVDIDIKHHAKTAISSIRDTVALFSTDTLPAFSTTRSVKYASRYDIFASLEEWNEYVTAAGGATNFTTTDKYVRIFFANNGNKIRILSITGDSVALTSAIKALPNEQIVVAYTGSESVMRGAASSLAGDATIYGINSKILLSNIATSSVSSLDASIDKYVLKATSTPGAEMTIAGYLSSINIYGSNTVQDYDFTREYDYVNSSGTTVSICETNDDTVYEACMTKHCNVTMKVAQYSRNLGGDTTTGEDLVNEFVLIVLHQTITERLVSLLTQKIKGASGVSAIHSAIDDEMSKYLTNGYLTTDEVWKDRDLTVDYNGVTYTLISTGDALLLGYKVTIIPFNALTDADRASRKAPPIYIVLADSYGIRSISIQGEVI